MSTRTLLFIGLLGSVFSLIGDFLLSFNYYPQAANVYVSLLASSQYISFNRLALSAIFGGIGIPLQAFGYAALAGIIANYASKYAQAIRVGAVATALFGGSVHLLCILWIMQVKYECLAGFSVLDAPNMFASIPPATLPLLIYAIIPMSVICMMPYFLSILTTFIAFVKGYTPMPRWWAVFNPIVCIGLLQTIALLFTPNNPLFNGLNMANKPIGAIITFALAIWFISTQKEMTCHQS